MRSWLPIPLVFTRLILLSAGLLIPALGLALALCWLPAGRIGAASAETGLLYVAAGGDCGGAVPCYATVQAAVDAARPGDEIRVAAGVYTGVSARAGVTQTVYISKTVTLRGGYTSADWVTSNPTANPTTLDAQGQGRVMVISNAPDVKIQGLNITGGDATGLGGSPVTGDAGGGLYALRAMSVTISENQIYGNSARTIIGDYRTGYGGGAYLANSDFARLEGNTIRGNGANRAWHGSGGGLSLDRSHHLTLKNNIIRDNVATTANGVGGGLLMGDCDYATVEGNIVHENITSIGADAYGGGMYLQYCHHASLVANDVRGNLASQPSWGYGGGLYLNGGMDVALHNTVVISNTAAANPQASGWGGGLYLDSSNALLINTVVTDNRAPTVGSGLYLAGASPRLLHATIARNSGPGGGVAVDDSRWGGVHSSVWLTNTIIVSHTVGISVTAGNTATLNATLWHDNIVDRDGAGTINHIGDRGGDPLFAADGYHLMSRSAAIDVGVDAGVTTDIDGQPRPNGSGYDLGADEFRREQHTYLPLSLKH